jgi:hypothetical protein
MGIAPSHHRDGEGWEAVRRELWDAVGHPEAYSQRPDVLELERHLANDLALVPWLATGSGLAYS